MSEFEMESLRNIVKALVQLNITVIDCTNELNRKLDKIIENQEEGKAK